MEKYVVSKDTFTAEVPNEILEHENFKKWIGKIDNAQLERIEAFKEIISKDGLITSAKSLKDGLFERKWINGLRVYFSIIEGENGRKTLLLLGSGKGKEQSRAILIAKTISNRYRVVKEDIKFNPNK